MARESEAGKQEEDLMGQEKSEGVSQLKKNRRLTHTHTLRQKFKRVRLKTKVQ